MDDVSNLKRLREAVSEYLAVAEMIHDSYDDASPSDQRILLERAIAARAAMSAIVTVPA